MVGVKKIAMIELELAKNYYPGDHADILPHALSSEKLDGVRCLYEDGKLWTRTGKRINCPDWFVEGFGAEPLDGELWAGRGQFEHVSACARKKAPQAQDWRAVRFMAFDMPEQCGSFDNRLNRLGEIAAEGPSYLRMLDQFKVVDDDDLHAHLDRIVKDGGEGIMIRNRLTDYEGGRSDNLLKLKPLEDEEGVVIAHTGKRSVRIKNKAGNEFTIGSGFSAGDLLPKVGAVVSYTFTGRTRTGCPRHASFWRNANVS